MDENNDDILSLFGLENEFESNYSFSEFFTNKEMFQQTFTKLMMVSTYEQVRQSSKRVLDNLENVLEVLEDKYGFDQFELHTEKECQEFFLRVKRNSDLFQKNIAIRKDNGERK